MNRMVLRMVALNLAFCLLLDPATAMGFETSIPSVRTSCAWGPTNRSPFQNQAVVQPPLSPLQSIKTHVRQADRAGFWDLLIAFNRARSAQTLGSAEDWIKPQANSLRSAGRYWAAEKLANTEPSTLIKYFKVACLTMLASAATSALVLIGGESFWNKWDVRCWGIGLSLASFSFIMFWISLGLFVVRHVANSMNVPAGNRLPVDPQTIESSARTNGNPGKKAFAACA